MPLTTIPPYSSPISSVITPMEKVRWTRRDLARKFGRYFNSRAAVRILLRVCSGMERAAAELFRTAETVPGVRPRCCATAFKVTTPFCFLGPEDLRVVIRNGPSCSSRVSAGSHNYRAFAACGIAVRRAEPLPIDNMSPNDLRNRDERAAQGAKI